MRPARTLALVAVLLGVAFFATALVGAVSWHAETEVEAEGGAARGGHTTVVEIAVPGGDVLEFRFSFGGGWEWPGASVALLQLGA